MGGPPIGLVSGKAVIKMASGYGRNARGIRSGSTAEAAGPLVRNRACRRQRGRRARDGRTSHAHKDYQIALYDSTLSRRRDLGAVGLPDSAPHSRTTQRRYDMLRYYVGLFHVDVAKYKK